MSPPTAALLFEDLILSEDFDLVDPVFKTVDDGQGALFAGNEFPSAYGGTIDLGGSAQVELARKIRDVGYTGPIPLPRDPKTAGARPRSHVGPPGDDQV